MINLIPAQDLDDREAADLNHLPSVGHRTCINVDQVLSRLHQFGETLLPPHPADPHHLLHCDSAAPLRCVGCDGAMVAR
ncbi:MAG: hypothetical protein P1T08_17730 [Acidimicrobiia bacterium]|nr:hypothetical protein [Acidimicrobiia bacterium]